DGDVGLGPGVGGAEIDAGVAVADDRVGVDPDVGQGTAGDELVGVDPGPAGRAGVVVVAEQVPLDDRRDERAVVGQEQAGDDVLDDVVQHVRAAGAGAQDDAGAELVDVGLVLNSEAVEGHVVGGDVEGGRPAVAVDHRLGGGVAGPRRAAAVNAELVAAQGEALVDVDQLRERALGDVDRAPGGGGVHGVLDGGEGGGAERQARHRRLGAARG